jgi:hypothetical protein
MDKAMFHTALVALAGYAIIAYTQKHVIQIPVVGAYLPGGL